MDTVVVVPLELLPTESYLSPGAEIDPLVTSSEPTLIPRALRNARRWGCLYHLAPLVSEKRR